MTEQQRLLLYLLKVGLGGDIEPGKQIKDIPGLYKLAAEQTVRGIAMDALLRHKPEDGQDRTAILEWYAWVVRLEKRNAQLSQNAAEAYLLFKEKGLSPIMAKGQTVALEYPKPEHRECGDIDLYFEEEEGRKAVEMVKSWNAYKTVNDFIRDYSFAYKGAKVEIHPYMVHSLNPGSTRYALRIHAWFTDEMTRNHRLAKIDTKSTEIAVPSVLHGIVYGFYHLWMHFVRGGVGLRQVCDWRMLLHNYHGKYDVEELRGKLEHFGLMRPWVGFSGILVDYLGLPEEEVPFYKKSAKTAKILKIIFEEGNFGHNIKRKAMPKGKFKRMIRKSSDTVSRYRKLCGIFPFDATLFLPGVAAVRRCLNK